jgi:hypothetical protein
VPAACARAGRVLDQKRHETLLLARFRYLRVSRAVLGRRKRNEIAAYGSFVTSGFPERRSFRAAALVTHLLDQRASRPRGPRDNTPARLVPIPFTPCTMKVTS